MPPNLPLAHWCRRLRASDRAAFEEVFRALHPSLFRYACSITRDDAAAGDICQDAFVELWERRATLDPDRSLRALLFRIVRNRAYNLLRDRKTHAAKHDLLRDARTHEPPRHDPAAAVQARALDEQLRHWIDALPSRQREALCLSRFEGLSHDDVAAVMHISPKTVNNHIVEALRTLRNRLRTLDPELLDS